MKLSTYEPLSYGIFLIGNEMQRNVCGIDTTQMKTHDSIVRTLSKVRHISVMTHNLILFYIL